VSVTIIVVHMGNLIDYGERLPFKISFSRRLTNTLYKNTPDYLLFGRKQPHLATLLTRVVKTVTPFYFNLNQWIKQCSVNIRMYYENYVSKLMQIIF